MVLLGKAPHVGIPCGIGKNLKDRGSIPLCSTLQRVNRCYSQVGLSLKKLLSSSSRD
jgi:hypothetical protein